MIFWDLDGVLRDLTTGISAHLGKPFDPQTWNEHVVDNLNLCDYIDRNLHILVEAPETEYYHLIADKEITILTVQPLHWLPYTRLWIKNHLPFAKVKWCEHPLEKMDYLKDGDVILEDYPNFPDNSKVIMVDRPYNRNVTGCFARVKNPAELERIIGE
jgi:hypothetical protein